MTLSKKKKKASKQIPQQIPGREAAVTPAAGVIMDRNEDLEFMIKSLRYWGNMWKLMGFKMTQWNNLARNCRKEKE